MGDLHIRRQSLPHSASGKSLPAPEGRSSDGEATIQLNRNVSNTNWCTRPSLLLDLTSYSGIQVVVLEGTSLCCRATIITAILVVWCSLKDDVI